MAEHRARTRVEDGREEIGLDRLGAMADRVDAWVDGEEVTLVAPVADSPLVDIKDRQLGGADPPKLPAGDLSHANFGVLVEHGSTASPSFAHGWRIAVVPVTEQDAIATSL